MTSFINELENTLNSVNKKDKVLTENGALAYKQTKRAINDFVFDITEMRQKGWGYIGEAFSKVFYEEDLEISCKFFAWVLDCREGAGERNIAKGIIKWMIENQPNVIEKLYTLIPFYGRYDILILLADPQFNRNEELRHLVLNTISNQFVSDLRNINTNKPVSLLGKWMPSENASSKNTRRLARQLQKDLHVSPKNYRRGLSMLRNKLRIVECDMSANNWENIAYDHVPSKANLNYSNAFMRHDSERRQEYLNSLKNGKTKINAKVLAPYEIIAKYHNNGWNWTTKPYDEALEQMWKALPQFTFNNMLVIRDGSGSMTSQCTGNVSCLDVATSLAIYCAEHNSKEWKDKFITFSSKPEFVDMSKCHSLREKINLCNRYDDCSNTNIYATMKLILNVAKKNKYKQSQMPNAILIVSDMAFDNYPVDSYNSWEGYSSTFNYDNTLFEKIQKEYIQNGYKLPKLIFWNVNARGTTTVPIQENALGLSLVSGFSTNIFKMVLSEDLDPYKQILSILNSERYKLVEDTLQI